MALVFWLCVFLFVFLAMWLLSSPVLWLLGSVARLLCGSLALWLAYSVAPWLCGSLVLWPFGSVAPWLVAGPAAVERVLRSGSCLGAGERSWRSRRKGNCRGGDGFMEVVDLLLFIVWFCVACLVLLFFVWCCFLFGFVVSCLVLL